MIFGKKPSAPDVGRLAELHYDAVWRFCCRRVGEAHASDATQDTFLTAVRRSSSFRGESEARTWLFGIALNVCRNLHRKSGRDLGEEWLQHLPEPDPAPAALERTTLRQALLGLSPEHREAVILHEMEGFSYREIGEIVGVPEGTVKSRLHHAFLALRKALAPEEIAR